METLEAKMDGLKQLFDEKFEENARQHEGITKRLDYTNGSIKKHEKTFNKIYGGIGVLVVLIPVIIFTANYFGGLKADAIANQQKIDNQIDTKLLRQIVAETLKEIK